MAIKKHNWDPPDWLRNPEAEHVIFHDERVEVYKGQVDVNSIHLWRDNDRTTLDIEHLLKESGQRDIGKLTDEQIIGTIIKNGVHKISDLAKSIKMNGVRQPLILTYGKELLDGNRRFIACKYLLAKEKQSDIKFETATAYCLKAPLSKSLKYKIISEMNFLPDYKVQWAREIRAKYVRQLFNEYKDKFGEKKAIKEVSYLLDIDKQDIFRFIEVLKMIEGYIKFVAEKSEQAKKDAEMFAREKFHFFEEFYNKGVKGKENKNIIEEDKNLFYGYLFNKQLISMTGIREFAAMLQYPPVRKIIRSKKETLDYAKSIYDDIVIPKRASSKIERFCSWLDGLSKNEIRDISDDVKKRLFKAIKKLETRL